jgi:branched-chain amino acid transport system permease protein
VKFGRWLPWLVVALLAGFPFVAPALGLDFYVGFVRRAMIFAIAAASLNFILGFGGMAALGQAGFVGVGAYALVAGFDGGLRSMWLLFPLAMIVAALMSAAIGAVALRTRGVYLLMSTLAFAQMLYFIAVSLRVYGGDDGYSLSERPSAGLGLDTADEATFYWIVLVLLVAAMLFFNTVVAGRFGRALAGVRDNEVRMRAMGYPVFRVKLIAFVVSGAVAGLAGALLVTHNDFISPSSMHWTQSATLIVMVVIGGVGLRWGGPLGAFVWIGLEELFKQFTEYWHLPLGVLLIAIVFVAPRGLASLKLPRKTA